MTRLIAFSLARTIINSPPLHPATLIEAKGKTKPIIPVNCKRKKLGDRIMSEHIAAPRITASSLDSFVNKHVSIVGKVTQLRGDQATIDADGNVTILLNRVSSLFQPPRSSRMMRKKEKAKLISYS